MVVEELDASLFAALILLALELANAANLDCFGGADTVGCRLGIELKSGISGMFSSDGNETLGGLGGEGSAVRVPDEGMEGGGSYFESL